MGDKRLQSLYWWLQRRDIEALREKMVRRAGQLEKRAKTAKRKKKVRQLQEEAEMLRKWAKYASIRSVRLYFYPQWETVRAECLRRQKRIEKICDPEEAGR